MSQDVAAWSNFIDMIVCIIWYCNLQVETWSINQTLKLETKLYLDSIWYFLVWLSDHDRYMVSSNLFLSRFDSSVLIDSVKQSAFDAFGFNPPTMTDTWYHFMCLISDNTTFTCSDDFNLCRPISPRDPNSIWKFGSCNLLSRRCQW